MANPEHVEIVKAGAGAEAIRKHVTDSSKLDLSGADLTGLDLAGADLAGARFTDANLSGAVFRHASLAGASFYDAIINVADFESADLRQADLTGASLRDSVLIGATCRDAELTGVRLFGGSLREADFSGARLAWGEICRVDLSQVLGLADVKHWGPTTVGVDTLMASRGQIPEQFLLGCGLTPWETIYARLYDPKLSPSQVEDLQRRAFELRSDASLSVGNVFISYSHANADFADKIYGRLKDAGASVWLDRHDMVAGSLQKQITRAIRLNDVVLLVLSEASVQSDWVENELDMARGKEKAEGRDVLCPVALDDSWKSKAFDNDTEERALWRTLTRKNILDFSKWKTKAFNGQFEKLLRGLKVNYPKQDDK